MLSTGDELLCVHILTEVLEYYIRFLRSYPVFLTETWSVKKWVIEWPEDEKIKKLQENLKKRKSLMIKVASNIKYLAMLGQNWR